MILNMTALKAIINEELSLISEGCGCGCKGAPGGCGGTMADIRNLDGEIPHAVSDISDLSDGHAYDSHPLTDREFLTKTEALKSVVAIAMSTLCPVTRERLLNAVEDIIS